MRSQDFSVRMRGSTRECPTGIRDGFGDRRALPGSVFETKIRKPDDHNRRKMKGAKAARVLPGGKVDEALGFATDASVLAMRTSCGLA